MTREYPDIAALVGMLPKCSRPAGARCAADRLECETAILGMSGRAPTSSRTSTGSGGEIGECRSNQIDDASGLLPGGPSPISDLVSVIRGNSSKASDARVVVCAEVSQPVSEARYAVCNAVRARETRERMVPVGHPITWAASS